MATDKNRMSVLRVDLEKATKADSLPAPQRRVLAGPRGRLIEAKWTDAAGGWSLSWVDTGYLIQHRLRGELELLDSLEGVLDEATLHANGR